MLKVIAHSSPLYPPRTYQNARMADLTVAFAIEFQTAGERLTKQAAGERYIAIPLSLDVQVAVERLVAALRTHSAKTLNVAGNGIYSLEPKGWPQTRADEFVFNVLSKVIEQWPITKVISGGQTGIDLAGVTAAHALGIDAEATLPKGFVQRGLDNQDRTHTEIDIRAQIEAGVEQLLKPAMPAMSPAPRAPRLYNIKRDQVPAEAVYIGRGSKCGNPFAIGPDGDRNAVCNQFEAWAPTQPDVMAAIEALRGRDLACYCAPYRCHGDWILKMANREPEPTPTHIPSQSVAITDSLQFEPQI